MPDEPVKPATPAEGAIPDLNDPNVRLSREDAMAAMLARRRESLAEDGADATATPTPPDPDADPDEAAAEEARRQIEAAAAGATPEGAAAQVDRQRDDELILSDEDLGRYKMRVKINGKEELIPLTDVRARAQKVGAADEYLATAKELLGEVKQMQRPAATPAAAAEPAAAAATPAAGGADPYEEFVDALFAGDDVKAKEVAKRMRATPAVSPDTVTQQVEQRIVLRSALRQFAKDHSEIVSDPMARRVADTFLLEETEGVPIEQIAADRIPEVLEAAGKRTKEWLTKMTGAPAQARATTPADRRALKARIDELPAAGARAASTAAQPKTTSDVIASMRAARGQLREPT